MPCVDLNELDCFTHELFTQAGAREQHSIPTIPPTRKHRLSIPHKEVQRHAVEILQDTAIGLLHETLSACLITAGSVGALVQFIGPLATLPVVVSIVIVVQVTARKVGRE